MKDVRSWSDRIAALKERQARFLRGSNKSQSQRLVAAHAAIQARGELRRRNFVASLECFGGFAIGVAALESELVGFDEQRLVLELFFDPADRRLHGAVVEPVAHAQREEILAAIHGLGVEAEMLQRTPREAFEFHGK